MTRRRGGEEGHEHAGRYRHDDRRFVPDDDDVAAGEGGDATIVWVERVHKIGGDRLSRCVNAARSNCRDGNGMKSRSQPRRRDQRKI
jgi:hypothetical protein